MAFKSEEHEDVVFDSAFAEALGDAGGVPDGDAPADDTPPDGGAPADDTAPDGDSPSAGADVPPASDPTPPAAKTAAELEADRLAAENAQLRAQLAQAPTTAAAPTTPTGPTPEEIQAQADEDQAWADFKTDWPEVAAMIEKKQQSTQAQLNTALELVNKLTAQVTPIAQAQAESAEEKFMQSILTVHKDASTLLPDVEKWIATLPRHRQIGANYVLDRGSAQDVIDLYTEFKDATGRATSATQTPPDTDQNSQTPAATNAERLRKMESVSTRRTMHQEPPDQTDFAGAFDDAVSGRNH